MKRIPINSRTGIVAHALVDDEDFERLSRFRWHFDGDGYPNSHERLGVNRSRVVRMAREVLGLEPGDGLIADHINRDKLDNRKQNLRVVTVAESAQNRGPRKRSRSRFRGVNYVAPSGKWIARVRLGNPGKLHNLGTFDSEEEAARAAADFRRQHMPYSNEDVAA